MGEAAVLHARRYALLAAERMGELLKATPRVKAGRLPKIGTRRELNSPKLPEIGVTKKESMRAQFLASLPNDIFEALLDGRITLTEAKRRAKRTAAHEKTGEPTELKGKFRVIYARVN